MLPWELAEIKILFYFFIEKKKKSLLYFISLFFILGLANYNNPSVKKLLYDKSAVH